MELVKGEATQTKELKAKAKLYFEKIVEGGGMASRGSMMIGFYAYRMKVESLFQVQGFEDENAARIASGVGESTWYANIRLAEQFKDLPEVRFVAMKQANAKQLARLPESKRYDSMWTRQAEVEKIEVFEAKIEVEVNGKASEVDTREISTSMKVSMPASRKALIESKAAIYAENHGIDKTDIGKAIEMSLVETTDGGTLTQAIGNTLQRFREVKDVIFSNLSAEEMVTKIDTLADEAILELEDILKHKKEQEHTEAA